MRKNLAEWMDGWMDGRESGVKDCLQQSKIKFQTILKLNFNGGQFYKKYKILVITKNCKFST